MATLGTVFVGSWAAMGGKKSSTAKGPQIQASSKDEEKFIQYVTLVPCRVPDNVREIGHWRLPARAGANSGTAENS